MKLMYPTLVAAMGLLVVLPVRAEGEDEAFPEEKNGEEMSEDEAFLEDKEQQEIAAPEKEKNQDLHEDDDEQIYSVGVRLRWIMIPEWVVGMFGVDMMQSKANQRGVPLISNVGVGPEFIYRRGGLDITAAIWYAGLGWNPISIKKEGEGEGAWEVVENDWKTILFTADFIWSTTFVDWFSLTYGVGLGFGIKWGQIVETEARAYPQDPNNRPYEEKCNGFNDPMGDPGCAEPDGDYGKEIWPAPIIPWFEVLLGMRFKPHKNVSIYVDGGFNLVFQVGMRVQYIF